MPQAVRTLPSAEYLHQCFEYDATTGELHWKHRPQEHFTTQRTFNTWNARYAGHLIGYPGQKGHMRVHLNKRHWHVARVIYKMHYDAEAEWIDHKDRNPGNNRPDNLRSATSRENSRNKIRPNRTAGVPGVAIYSKRFRAKIREISGKVRHLGTFDTAEEAHAAYREASIRIFGEFSPFHD